MHEIAPALLGPHAQPRDLIPHVGGEDVGIAHVPEEAAEPCQLAAGLLDPRRIEQTARFSQHASHAPRRDAHPVHARAFAAARHRIAPQQGRHLGLQIRTQMLDRGRLAPDALASGRRQAESLEDLRTPIARLRAGRAQLLLEPRDQPFGAIPDLLDLDLVELAHDAGALDDLHSVVHDLDRLVVLRAHAHGAPQRVQLRNRLQRGAAHVGGQQAGQLGRDLGAVGLPGELEAVAFCRKLELPEVATVL